MPTYTMISVIYNPNSTGSGKKLATDFITKLQQQLPKQPIQLLATEYAGHGEKLAYQQARATKRPLLISASGDGGYHDVVNGAMRAQHEGARPVTGLLPAGNANDHYHSLHQSDIVADVVNQQEQLIDLLKLRAVSHGAPIERYSHSYIGVGLTPKVGKELNRTQLNRLNELWIMAKVLVTFRPIRLRVNGQVRAYESLVFSNVERMSKVFHLSPDARVDDNQFEVTTHYRRSRWQLIASLFKASTVGLTDGQQVQDFQFETIRPTLLQLDGEIIRLDAGTTATITLEHQVLRCIV